MFKTGAKILLRMPDWSENISLKFKVDINFPGLVIITLSSKMATLMSLGH